MTPLSRFHLFSAAAMYFGAPAWMVMALAAVAKIFSGDVNIDAAAGSAMFFGMLAISLAPKLVGLLDVALTPGGAARFGGGWRLARSALADLALSMLMAPVVAFQVSIFLVGLAMGHRVPWNGQVRDAYRVEWGEAARRLWPQTLFGLALLAIGLIGAGSGVAWASPMIAGLMLAIPFAVVTADPRLGRWAERTGLCALPEEIAPSGPLARLAERERPEPPITPLKAA